jgi:DNA recombination protein RmuC
VLAAALAADPGLFEEAMAKKVVLASPGTLLALLRTVAFTWQQDALTTSARELLALGNELYARLGSLGSHATKMGTALRRSVESYNAMVGALESRVLVTARKMHQLDLEPEPLADLLPVEDSPRPLTASELLDAVADEGCRPELDLDLELDRVTADRTRAQGRDSA